MAPWLQSRGYEVMGIDNGYLQIAALPELGSIATVKKDIRELAPSDYGG